VNLAEVATDVVHDLDAVLRDADAVVRVDRLPVVHGDAVQLRGAAAQPHRQRRDVPARRRAPHRSQLTARGRQVAG